MTTHPAEAQAMPGEAAPLDVALYTHPHYLGLRSQDQFAAMLADGLRARGHRVVVRRPLGWLQARWPWPRLAKWAGYADQYLLFAHQLRAAVRRDPPGMLQVLCDQALGPWVPRLADRPHVVHCHDLLALRSALGELPEHPTALSGRVYQRYIRAGFRQARHFISISEKTRADLLRIGGVRPQTSEVVYNGLARPYSPLPAEQAQARLCAAGIEPPAAGYLLHVGAGQWYKNTAGVLALYAAVVRRESAAGRPVPALWMVSPPPGADLREALAAVPAGSEVRFIGPLTPQWLQAAYAAAHALLFPSLEEGFGWPIAEAMACGCPVVTTDAAPMTEVGGDAPVYLPRLCSAGERAAWAAAAAPRIGGLLPPDATLRDRHVQAGLRQARRFDGDRAIDAYVAIYRRVLAAARATAMPGAR